SVMVAGPVELPQDVLHSTSSLSKVTLTPASQPAPTSRPPVSVRVGRPPKDVDEARFASSLTLLASVSPDAVMTTDSQLALSGPSAHQIAGATPIPVVATREAAPKDQPRRRWPIVAGLSATALALAMIALGVSHVPRQMSGSNASPAASTAVRARPSPPAVTRHPAVHSPAGHAAGKPSAKPAVHASTSASTPSTSARPSATKASAKASANAGVAKK
ncbi:MAG: hypothetical protein ACHREM_18240, partial [Polyangiales bacterium]